MPITKNKSKTVTPAACAMRLCVLFSKSLLKMMLDMIAPDINPPKCPQKSIYLLAIPVNNNITIQKIICVNMLALKVGFVFLQVIIMDNRCAPRRPESAPEAPTDIEEGDKRQDRILAPKPETT